MNISLSTSSREIYGIARDILVNKTRFMDLKQGKVTGERYKLKYKKNKPVFDIYSKKEILTDEEKAIKEKAIANGTFMKAPNGKSSNLSEKQWLTVRTKNFKKWFGDWEKSFRIKKLLDSKPITFTGDEYKGNYELNNKSASEYILNILRKNKYINKDTNEVINISRKGAEKVTHHDAENIIHLKSIACIPSMLENAIFISEEKNNKNNNKFDSYRYYVVGLKKGTENYTAKLTVGVKNGKIYYDHSLTEIEKSSLIRSINSLSSEFASNNTAPISNDRRIIEILQDNTSKIIDENGEPLVVYHGTEYGGHHTFNAEEYAKSEPVTWFVDNEKVAYEYARNWESEKFDKEEGSHIYSCFLNIKNPVVLEANGKDYNSMEGEIYKATLDKNYDGVIVHNIKDNRWNEGYIKDAYTGTSNTYAVHNSNQIKSATDNIGTFDEDNDDIRFSVVQDEKLPDELENGETVKVGDEVDATGFDEYLDERAEGITSKEDIKKAKELARIAKKKAIGEKYLEQQRKINKAIEKSRKLKNSSFKEKENKNNIPSKLSKTEYLTNTTQLILQILLKTEVFANTQRIMPFYFAKICICA